MSTAKVASKISMKQLLEAGVHFGHQTKRWNPKMKKYIFGERNGIYIIDLQKTVVEFNSAYEFIKDMIAENEYIVFVGTKKQAQDAIKEQAERCGMFYVNQRWLGGTFTNFTTICRSIARLRKLEAMKEDGTYELVTKKERLRLEKERLKLDKVLSGIKGMDRLPGVLFIVDPKKEHIAVNEANKMNIPVVSIVDTNCDPDRIKYVIPGNDDAIRAIRLITSKVADAVIEGKELLLASAKVDEKKEEELKADMKATAADHDEQSEKSVSNQTRSKKDDKTTDKRSDKDIKMSKTQDRGKTKPRPKSKPKAKVEGKAKKSDKE